MEQKVTFQAAGFAPDVITAEVQSWGALTSVLGPDSEDRWSLTKIEHFHVPADPTKLEGGHKGVQWVATYTRSDES